MKILDGNWFKDQAYLLKKMTNAKDAAGELSISLHTLIVTGNMVVESIIEQVWESVGK